MDMFPRKKARTTVNLNLIAIMNIFAVLIIFFIKANVIGETAVEVPENIKIPKSISNETVDTAPEVIILKDEVKFKLVKRSIDLESLREKEGSLSKKANFLRAEIVDYIENIDPESREFGLTVNVVANNDIPYRDLYEVVRFLKKAGFQYVLFIAEVADN